MEKLKIKNFLILENVEIEIKKYNFVLGRQASGKSLVAKILFFMYQIPFLLRKEVLNKNTSFEAFKEVLYASFKLHFHEKYWKDQDFSIIYKLNDMEISITNEKNQLSINIPSVYRFALFPLFDTTNIAFDSADQLTPEGILKNQENNKKSKETAFSKILNGDDDLALFFRKTNTIFIPSSRCLYALIAEKPATYSDIFSSDPILKAFGNMYENFKEIYDVILTTGHADDTCLNDLKNKAKKILNGTYLFEDKQDFLCIDNKKINIKHTSSGQQEALPLILMLILFTRFNAHLENSKKQFIFIEEPEAHLFPEAQADMMALLSIVGSESGLPLFITTHSPYLLSILNNYIYGSEMIEKGQITLKQFKEITNNARPIPSKDVNAFTLEDGVSRNLIAEKESLIDSDMLDGASDIINEMFDKFIELTPVSNNLYEEEGE